MQGTNRLGGLFVKYAVYLACILSNLSQLPYFVRNDMTQLIAFPGWIILALAVLFTGRVRISKSAINICFTAILFVVWCGFLWVFTSHRYFSSSLMYAFFISLLVFVLGNVSADHLTKNNIRSLMILYTATTFLLTAAIFVQYFGLGYNLSTKLYAYSSKNSVSQIICSTILVLIVYFRPKKIVVKCLRIIILVFEIYVLILLRSRATLVGLILCAVFMALSKNIKQRTKIIILLIGMTTIVLLFTSAPFYNTVFNNILFAGRDVSDLNELSSGRVVMLGRFPQMIKGHWMDGIGSVYYESFPLSAILQFGLLGGLTLIGISLTPLISATKRRNVSTMWVLLFYVAVGYIVNGLFEGLTPFGPGIKCYFLWLLYGVLIKNDYI